MQASCSGDISNSGGQVCEMFLNYAVLFSWIDDCGTHPFCQYSGAQIPSLSTASGEVYCQMVEFVSHFMHKQQSNSMWQRNAFACGRKLYFANFIRKYVPRRKPRRKLTKWSNNFKRSHSHTCIIRAHILLYSFAVYTELSKIASIILVYPYFRRTFLKMCWTDFCGR